MAETTPDRGRLERLLCEAFEFAPGPDMRRLAEIEARLLRAAPPAIRHDRGLPWWALILLAGGAAAAAWWGSGQVAGQKAVRERRPPVETMERAAPEGTARAGSSRAEGREGDRRIIDRREDGH